jgi:hypothetical protein
MLSLIVCSVNPIFLQQLKESVAATVGVEHEWLIWDNRATNLGICEVYNRMASNARYSFLCFLHEDLIFKTNSWGIQLVTLLQQPSVGLVGIAGSNYKSRLYSGWYSGGGAKDYSNIFHRLHDSEYRLSFPDGWSSEQEVVTLDGVFMGCPKHVWQQHQFDQQLLTGFHFYDIDFSLRVARTSRVLVTPGIDMVHLTVGGDFGDRWVEQAFKFHEAMQAHLPFTKADVNKADADHRVARYWLDWLKNYKISASNRLKWIMNQGLHKKPGLWYSVAKFLLYRPLRLRRIHEIFKKKAG